MKKGRLVATPAPGLSLYAARTTEGDDSCP
jgi:hypothetical protein